MSKILKTGTMLYDSVSHIINSKSDLFDRVIKEFLKPCDKPPEGWKCTREMGHDGPCAAVPDDPTLDQRYIEIWNDAINSAIDVYNNKSGDLSNEFKKLLK